MALLAGTMLNVVSAVPALLSRQLPLDPFTPIDPQNWVSGSGHLKYAETLNLTLPVR
jgi:hypothetical protein